MKLTVLFVISLCLIGKLKSSYIETFEHTTPMSVRQVLSEVNKPHPCHNNVFDISLINMLSHSPYRKYYWGINGVSVIFFIIKLNNIFGENCIGEKCYDTVIIKQQFISTHLL
jgi:hypothetical protein